MTQFPKLRHVEAVPIEHDGRKLALLRDPFRISDKVVVLPIQSLQLVGMLDGNNSILEIQTEIHRRTGQLVFREQIEKLVEALEQGFLIEGPTFEKEKARQETEWAALAKRPAAHAGASYHDDGEELRRQMARFFDEGPGKAGEAAGGRLTGIVAPHIDLRVGGACAAFAYRAVEEAAERPDLFVVLGTSHFGTEERFIATRKDYDTPLGAARTDGEFLDALERRFGEPLCPGDIVHKVEHSIEFQAVFLQYLETSRNGARIVPILCPSFQRSVQAGSSPSLDGDFARFAAALRETIASCGQRVCLVAGADLAHVGRRFGDEAAPDGEDLRIIERLDRELLEAAARSDAEAFFSRISREKDCRRICGYPPIYTMLKTIEAREGKLLKYGQNPEPETGSVVTFASMAFWA